jgi:hypothetical protein
LLLRARLGWNLVWNELGREKFSISKLATLRCRQLLLEHPEEIVRIGHRLNIRVWLQ